MIDWILVIQFILVFTAFILGFLVCIPIGVNKSDYSDYSGSCLLYAEIKYSSGLWTFADGGSVSSCNYVIYAGVTALLLGFVMLVLTGIILYRNLKEVDQKGKSWLVSLIQLAVTALMTFFMFVAACIVSVGFHNFCDSVEETASKAKFKATCQQFEQVVWVKTSKKVPQFHSKLRLAEVSSWISVAVWTALILLSVWRFRLSRRGGADNGQPAVVKQERDLSSEPMPKPI